MFIANRWLLFFPSASALSIANSIVIERIVVLLVPPCLSELLLPLSPLLLHADNVQHVAQVDERRCGNKNDLQHPEANVGDGEGFVVADILATRLLRVTGEIRLLITPNLFGCCTQNQDAEDKKDSQPNLQRKLINGQMSVIYRTFFNWT